MSDIFDVKLNDTPYYLIQYFRMFDSYEDTGYFYKIIKSDKYKPQIKYQFEREDSYDYGGNYGWTTKAKVFGPFMTHGEAERKANELINKEK